MKRNSQYLFLSILCAFAVMLCVLPTHAQDDIDALIEDMTLEQKVSQMFFISLFGEVLTDVGRDFLEQYQPGGIVLFEYNVADENAPEALTSLINDFQQTNLDAGGLPLFIAADQEGGIIATFEQGFTAFPVPYLVSAANNPDLAYTYGQAIAEELLAVGVNMNLAPVADVETNLRNPIILRRAYSSDPSIVAETISYVIEGMQDAGVMSIVKHFPGHGETTEDSHVVLPVVTVDRERLDSVELVPFGAAIDSDVTGVMVAHVWYPALEPQENTPASLSQNVVTGVLREEMGYTGLILTDAMDMGAITTNFGADDAAVMAVQAGIDLIVLGPNMGLQTQERAILGVLAAVQSGEIPESRIDESVRRILEAKARYAVLDWEPLEPTTTNERLNLDAHTAFVYELFQAGITIAYDANDLLPLTAEDSVAIIYPGSRLAIQRECSVYNPSIEWYAVAESPTESEIVSATNLALHTQITIVFTQDAYYNAAQQALVNALPPETTVVIATVSPYDWLAFPNIAGYGLTYSPLPSSVPAMCGILFGAFPVQGRLPVELSPELRAGIASS